MTQELYVVVETIDYNNGETMAESVIVLIDDKAKCVKQIADLQEAWAKVAELHDVADTYFWFEDEAEIKHSFAVKRPL